MIPLNVNAQFIGADFHYALDKTIPNDTLSEAILEPGFGLSANDPNVPVKYKVYLRLYFSCFHEDFHQQQPISVHEHMANIQAATLNLNLDSISIVSDYLTVACASTNEQCLKIGYYSGTVELKNMAGGYDITWGTCCWDYSVTNIDNLQMQGLAMVLHVPTSMSQQFNSSPVFTSLPQVLTCPDKIMNINTSALDKDGDMLVYHLIHPYTFEQEDNKGAVDHSDLFPAQNTYKPLIVGRPPFKKLAYAAGYNANGPLGNSDFSVNRETGSLDVQAVESGRYLVGVGVSEYRNDVLLSETQRIFLMEVLADPIINAYKD